ncbi:MULTISPECIES: hypothetical protein [unclassified Ensifer]|uniref:hypothetical protein n=1 Tax=unclassified Ensifer TaxID=2633371 RepID=UPI0008137129|nr:MULTISPECIES: hypothetical protein [unclassified Ensifer]OCP22015.1 hypothetical protein BC361_25965 [Ensifer sp. LC54]OCP23205.1 hypothetical protein BC363_24800 [Ensifer sp. LC384]
MAGIRFRFTVLPYGNTHVAAGVCDIVSFDTPTPPHPELMRQIEEALGADWEPLIHSWEFREDINLPAFGLTDFKELPI